MMRCSLAGWPSQNFAFRIFVNLSLLRAFPPGISPLLFIPMNSERNLRIVSFLPSATEMACALGLLDQLVGISHACDYPPETRGKPVVVHSAIPVATMSLAEIDRAVSEHLRRGASLYLVDERLLRELAPTHILTQDLCQVCAPAGNEVTRALRALPRAPEVLWMSPHSIEDVYNDLLRLGQATGRLRQAQHLAVTHQTRLQTLERRTHRAAHFPRVFCLEWLDPVYCCGHWVPEMVELAGGTDVLGRSGKDSVRVSWDEVARAAPEILIVMPCGFCLSCSTVQAARLFDQPACADLPAIRNNRVYAVDAGYFSRPGPRIVEGTQLLAHILHPELCAWNGPCDAVSHIDRGARLQVSCQAVC